MPRIHVRAVQPLAGFSYTGMRLVVVKGDYDAHFMEYLFPQGVVPEAALEITNALGKLLLFVKCMEYTNEIEWDRFPDGGQPYFIRA